MYNTIRKYIKRGGKIVGVMFAGVSEIDDKVGFGWSLCTGKTGDVFTKEKCMDIAVGRAECNFRDEYVFDDIPMSIQKELPDFVKRMHTYYKRNEFFSFVNDLIFEYIECENEDYYDEDF